MELSDRVRYLRKDILNMSQSDFAAALGTSRDVINNIEGNRLKKPGQKEPLLRLICERFSVNESWLINGDGEPNVPPEDEEATYVSELLRDDENPLYDLIRGIMKTYSELSEPDKKVVKTFAKSLQQSLGREGRD